jgi:hypothetical protein
MDLVFVHGRAQGGRKDDLDALEQEWLDGLHEGIERAGVDAPSLGEVRLPFYGAKLDELTEALAARVGRVVERGGPASNADIDPLEAAIIERLAERAGVTEDDIRAELDAEVLQRGPENWEWVRATARALFKQAPWIAAFGIGRFTADVNAYLTRPHIRAAVHEIVSPAIAGRRCVVVAHSLGTIIAYWLLAEEIKEAEVPLLITAGSPLGIDAVKSRLPRPRKFPPGVRQWLNVADEDDPVALYARLDRRTFLEGIENLSDVDNRDEPHSIRRYLADTTVARRIARALA